MLQLQAGRVRASGTRRGAEGGCFLHNTRYDFNDEVIPVRRGVPCGAGRSSHAVTAMSPVSVISRKATPKRATSSSDAAHVRAGARRFRHVHPSERGAVGEELSMDFAFVGKPGASNGLLLVISATHGVEGFCGSGCQVALLHDDATSCKAIERSKTSKC